MARDYAQRSSGSRHAKPKGGGGGGVPGWVWMVAGLSIGLAVAAFVYIGRPLQHDMNGDDRAVMTDKSDKPGSRREPVKIPPKEKPRFTFYELLPNQEVVVPRDVQPPPGKTATGEDDGQYIIQVASYRKQSDADAQRAKLALLGVESRVEKVTIDNKDTFYRVRIGPEKGLGRAHTTMARLEENGIQGMLVKVR